METIGTPTEKHRKAKGKTMGQQKARKTDGNHRKAKENPQGNQMKTIRQP